MTTCLPERQRVYKVPAFHICSADPGQVIYQSTEEEDLGQPRDVDTVETFELFVEFAIFPKLAETMTFDANNVDHQDPVDNTQYKALFQRV